MSYKKTIQRILFYAFWVGILTGMTLLLVAAVQSRNKEKVHSFAIEIKAGAGGSLLTKEEVAQMLQGASGTLKGEGIASFQLRQVEKKLKSNSWIRDAQLYIDNQDVLHVEVREKIPVARLFTANGYTCYLDELGKLMPLSPKRSYPVPVFTGLPDQRLFSQADTVLFNQLLQTTQLLSKDSFWLAQVAQLDFTKELEWELIPVVGDHIVKLGSLTDVEEKLRRLLIFYQQVLSKAGMSHYKVIDVRFNGQVVAARAAGGKVDSVQLRKSVAKLLKDPQSAVPDTVVRSLPKPIQPLMPDEPNPTLGDLKSTLPGGTAPDSTKSTLSKQKKTTNN